MVHRGDVGLKGRAQQIAQGWHQGLEAAEPDPHAQHMPQAYLARCKALAHGYRKGVHG